MKLAISTLNWREEVKKHCLGIEALRVPARFFSTELSITLMLIINQYKNTSQTKNNLHKFVLSRIKAF